MKKNVVFWVGVVNPDPKMLERHGNFTYLEYSKNTWKPWCRKNNVEFVEYTFDDVYELYDISIHKPTWTRWFDVFRIIRSKGIEFDKIAVVDGSSMVRWDCPNFFNECPSGKLTAYRSLENLHWLFQSASGYGELHEMDNVKFDYTKYITCGFQIFDKTHEKFLNLVREYYWTYIDQILLLQNEKVKRGTDQPVYNYLLQKYGVDVYTELNPAYMLTHLNRFDWMSHNWQLGDNTPFFIRYGYIWFFSGMAARAERHKLMSATWDLIKHNYYELYRTD